MSVIAVEIVTSTDGWMDKRVDKGASVFGLRDICIDSRGWIWTDVKGGIVFVTFHFDLLFEPSSARNISNCGNLNPTWQKYMNKTGQVQIAVMC